MARAPRILGVPILAAGAGSPLLSAVATTARMPSIRAGRVLVWTAYRTDHGYGTPNSVTVTDMTVGSGVSQGRPASGADPAGGVSNTLQFRLTPYAPVALGDVTISMGVGAHGLEAGWWCAVVMTECAAPTYTFEPNTGIGPFTATAAPVTSRYVGLAWSFGATDITINAPWETVYAARSVVGGMGSLVVFTGLGTGSGISVAATATDGLVPNALVAICPFVADPRYPLTGE